MNCQNQSKEVPCRFYPNFYNSNKWSEIPYHNQQRPYSGIDARATSWATYYIKKDDNNVFRKLDGTTIALEILNPCNIDFNTELIEVESIQANLTQCQEGMATFWGTGVPIQQWTPIFLQLISTYKVTPPKSARILSCLQNVVNDAFVVAWHLKYLWDYPRACQLNRSLITFLDTPKFPTYPSGHSVVSGAIEIVLSYFFPSEKEKIHELADDASISRLYGGIHFRSDLSQGLRLGRQIGSIAVDYFKTQYDIDSVMLDTPYTNFENAPIMPKYCLK